MLPEKNREEKNRTKKKKYTKKKNIDSYSIEFENWWANYPRKEAKAVAYQAYQDALDRGVSHERLLDRVMAFKGTDKAQGEFCPHPSTWLNQARYDDDPASWNGTRKRNDIAQLPIPAEEQEQDNEPF